MRAVSVLAKNALQHALMRGAFTWRVAGGHDSALTFDDGPNEQYTPKILELLARHGVKASFFLVGTAMQRSPELVRQIAHEGHCIGSHTLTHRDLPSLTTGELEQELVGCRTLIKQMTGRDTNLIRPPRGRINTRSLLCIKRWGYHLVHWSKTYSDYLKDGTAPLLNRIRSQGLEPSDIALLHDNNGHTVEALAAALPEWLARGVTFVRLA